MINEMQPVLDRIPSEWGKEILFGSGWNALVLELDRKLSELDPSYVVHQAKEKFGGLRYYAELSQNPLDENTTEEFRRLIQQAEYESYSICETCGDSGSRRNSRGYIHTACDAHVN